MNSLICKKNAIESNTFVLVFERPFNKQELQSLLRLENALKNDLPSFNEINSINVRLEGGQVTPSQEMIGVLLQCFKADGKPSIELKIEGNIIEIMCFSYDRWINVWGKAKQFLLEAIKSIDNDNKLIICVLKVVDKFLYDGDSKDYKVSDIFNQNTQLLTRNILSGEKTRLWHVFQGWFEEPEILNNLNISTLDSNGKTLTTIEHDIRRQFQDPQIISDIKEKLDDIFSSLHEKNKTVIKSLLNEEQLKGIGLCNLPC
ncbi:MAG: TIGR04255 family protein [Methylobacter sp.]|jgi:uncharacterized protein (TIGR04255 family)|nr:TIGR04255 family protein [Methylobacter sp.]